MLDKKTYWHTHKTHLRELGKSYRVIHKDILKKQLYAWRKKNPQKCFEIWKRSYVKNRKKILKRSRIYYEKNKNVIIKRQRIWEKRNLLKIRLYKHNRWALLKTTGDRSVTYTAIKKILGLQSGKCVICKKSIVNCFQIDHIIPISKGGKHTIWNIQLLCRICNSKKSNKMKEKDIQKSILQYLQYKKIFCYKQSSVGIYRKSTDSYIPNPSRGAPDLVCIIDGKYVGIEVKTKRGVQSPAQLEFQRKIEEAGGKYVIARSVEDVYEIEKI